MLAIEWFQAFMKLFLFAHFLFAKLSFVGYYIKYHFTHASLCNLCAEVERNIKHYYFGRAS